MASTIVPINNFLGTFTSPAVSVPDTASQGSIAVSGAAVSDPSLRVSIAIDFSPDGGITWASTSPGPTMNPFPVIATFAGGTTDRRGNAVTSFGVAANFPPGANRMLRGTFIVDGVALTGQATLAET